MLAKGSTSWAKKILNLRTAKGARSRSAATGAFAAVHASGWHTASFAKKSETRTNQMADWTLRLPNENLCRRVRKGFLRTIALVSAADGRVPDEQVATDAQWGDRG